MEDTPNVVASTFSMKTHPVEVLFDFGATHSFISTRLVEALGLASTSKHSLICISLPDGKAISCEEPFMGCPI